MSPLEVSQLSTLSDLVQSWRIRNEERALATHSNFNVFTTVLQSHDEVRLHNRFIHNLLNPLGTHDCGDLFLRLFFDVIEEAPDSIKEHTYTVRKEASTHQGQLDLLLESPEMGIAIENKIYAGEQHRQLARYATYLKEKHGDNSLLIYLTLDGKESYTHEDADYLRISYRDHILAWLDKCLAATFSIIPINQVLIQYRHVVRTITGRTLEHQAMKEIADHLVANPGLILMRENFNSAIEEVKARALDLLAESLINELPSEYPGKLRANMINNRFGSDPFGSIRISPTSGSFQSTPYEIVIEHISKWAGLVIGIESKWNAKKLNSTDEAVLTKLNQLLEVEFAENSIHKADPQKTWNGEYWPVGWHDLEQPWIIPDQVIIDLLDTQKRTAFAKEIIAKAMIQIELLEKLHVEAISYTINPTS